MAVLWDPNPAPSKAHLSPHPIRTFSEHLLSTYSGQAWCRNLMMLSQQDAINCRAEVVLGSRTTSV